MYSQALKAAVDRLDPASFASISPRHGERNRGRDGIAQGGVEDHAPPRHGSLGSAPRAPYGRPSGHLWLRHHRVHTEPKLYSMSYLTIDGSLVVVTAGEGGGYEELKYTSDFAISYKPKREMVLGLQLLSCVLKFQLRCYTRKFRLIQTWRTASF